MVSDADADAHDDGDTDTDTDAETDTGTVSATVPDPDTDDERLPSPPRGADRPDGGRTVTLVALEGAVGTLTRVPIRRHEAGWAAAGRTPWTFPVVGGAIGAVAGAVLLLPLTPATAAVALPVAIYGLTGLVHVDGLADVADAAAVHGGADRRREALEDPAVGAAGTLAVALAVLGLAAAGAALATMPVRVGVGIIIAAEVGAKLAMATLVCVGDAARPGLGAAVAAENGPADRWPALLAALPATAATWPHPAAVGALLAGPAVAIAARRRASRLFGGIGGDVLGASNEIARLVGLHLGVTLWLVW